MGETGQHLPDDKHAVSHDREPPDAQLHRSLQQQGTVSGQRHRVGWLQVSRPSQYADNKERASAAKLLRQDTDSFHEALPHLQAGIELISWEKVSLTSKPMMRPQYSATLFVCCCSASTSRPTCAHAEQVISDCIAGTCVLQLHVCLLLCCAWLPVRRCQSAQ